MSELKTKYQRLVYLLPLVILVIDIAVRFGSLRNLSNEDLFFYSLSFVYELILFFISVKSLRKYPSLLSVFIASYLTVIFASHSFYHYFNTLPGINTFSFLYSSPENSLEIIKHDLSLFYLLPAIGIISLAVYFSIKSAPGILPFKKYSLIAAVIFFIAFTLVLNNNTRLKDNRTLPFTNVIFAAKHGYSDYKNNSKIVQIGNRTFTIRENPLGLKADFNVILIMNESLNPYYLMEFGSRYAADSLMYKRITANPENFFLFQNAHSNSTVTAVSVPFAIAGLNPVQGKHTLIQTPLIYDFLKHHYKNVNTAYITSWSYDDYPNFKSFFNSKNLDYYIYREKIGGSKVVDMGCDDTVITKRFADFLKTVKSGNSFFSIFHYSNTHFPHYSPDQIKLFENKNSLLADYLNSVRYFDRNIDELFNLLRSSGQLDKTIIIFTSDHSESVGEHIRERGHFGKFSVWKTKVPFWIYMPDALRNRFPASVLRDNTGVTVSNNDAVPTLMDIYRIPFQAGMKYGKSLFKPLDKHRDIYIYNGPGENRTDSKEYFGAVNDTAYFIATKYGNNIEHELFVMSDPYQRNNLFNSGGAEKKNYLRILRELKIFH